jgi:ribokinase
LAAFDVIVCGSLHLDIVVNAPALPRIDETAVGSAWKQVCGGKGGNQAVQAARAGVRTAMIGRIGKDKFGETLQSNLVAEGIDVSEVKVDPRTGSGMSVAILQNDGGYGAVIVSGANLNIEPASAPNSWHALGGAPVLVLQNEVPEAVNLAVAEAAHQSQAKVILNAAPARKLSNTLLERVGVLVVNKVEAEMMSGVPVQNRSTAREALSRLRMPSCDVIITLGGDGLVLAEGDDEIVEMEAVPAKVTSTHGAGDCFVGSLAAQLAAGFSFVEACRAASGRAAAFVSRTV